MQLNDKNGAMFAYENAMTLNDNIEAKESAMYNYCIIIEENNILPFNKKVEVYEKVYANGRRSMCRRPESIKIP